MPRHVVKVHVYIQDNPASAGNPYTRFAGVQDLAYNDPGPTEVDATGIDDDDSVTLNGIPQANSLSPTLFLDPTNQAAQWDKLNTYRTDQTERRIQLHMIGTTKMFTTQGKLGRLAPQFGRGNALTVQTEWKLSGGLTMAAIPV